MTASRRTLSAFAAMAVIAVAAFAGAAAFSHVHGSGSSEHAVRDFLTDAVVDRDGVDACAYASSRSLQRLLSVDPRGMSCVTAVAVYAHLTLGGEPVATEAAVKALSCRAERQADGAERVTVSARGDSRAFVLRRATHRELTEFDAPSTPWRIESGFVELLLQ